MTSRKPNSIESAFGISPDSIRDAGDQQIERSQALPNGSYAVRIISCSIYTIGQDGVKHDEPTIGLIYAVLPHPGHKGVSYLQFRPQEGISDDEYKDAKRKFGIKMSSLFGASGVDPEKLSAAMSKKNWTADEKKSGQKRLDVMTGATFQLTLKQNLGKAPRDPQAHAYFIQYVTAIRTSDLPSPE